MKRFLALALIGLIAPITSSQEAKPSVATPETGSPPATSASAQEKSPAAQETSPSNGPQGTERKVDSKKENPVNGSEKPSDANTKKPEKVGEGSEMPVARSAVKGQDKKPEKRRLPHIGSMNSQKIPGQPWRIHDALRPRPPMVTPGEKDHLPPSDAIILFDGTDLSSWCHRESQGESVEFYEAQWNIVDGCLEVAPRTGSIYTIESYSSCQLHIEWMIPEGTTGTSQGRGNSGIKLMERFEVQVLDSFKNRTYADGQAGSIYGQYPPMVNAVRKQGEWQTYEIFFQAPRFDEKEKLLSPAFLTVLHNGVLVQLNRELPGPTGARLPAYSPLQPAAPIMLQDHGNKIRFRNIWLRPLSDEALADTRAR